MTVIHRVTERSAREPLPKSRVRNLVFRLFDRKSVIVRLSQLACIVIFVGIWQYASGRWVEKVIIGDPLGVVRSLYDYLATGVAWNDIEATAEEFLLGYAMGAVAGVVVAIILAQSRVLSSIFGPFITALNAIPKIALAPLFVIILGIGIGSKLAIAGLTVFFVMFYTLFSAIRNQQTALLDVLRVMGARKLTMVRRVVIPQAMPSVVGGLRAGVPFGMVGVIVGEFIASEKGIGYFIVTATQHFDIDSTFAGIIILIAMVWLGNAILEIFERRIMRYR